jgi:valyl-tRNA synthetase
MPGLVGKKIMLPLVNREIPLIADDFVDREFGTGAVKVTPAHDPNDFAMGQRHGMEPIVVMDEGGIMTGPIPAKYIGIDRFPARKLVVEEMTALGLVDKIEEHKHAVGHCYRCAYRGGALLFRPVVRAHETARQGRAPPRLKTAYISTRRAGKRPTSNGWRTSATGASRARSGGATGSRCGTARAAKRSLRRRRRCRCPKCGSNNLTQDNDVLDTWFSSWLWPFSTMGWPENTALLKKFYPTDVLVTAPEILFFWVARMIMAGLHFMGELPFTDIILHGTVRDKTGRKMSKSLGNALDPMEIIPTYGADALRFSMTMITAQGADVFLSKDTFDIGRNFANKLWNASRFLLGTIETPVSFQALPPVNRLKAEDRWILSRLQKVIASMTDAITGYRFNEAAHTIYDFTWKEFCDWYVEAKKSDLYQSQDPQRKTTRSPSQATCWPQSSNCSTRSCRSSPRRYGRHCGKRSNSEGTIDAEYIMLASYPIADKTLIDETVEQRFSPVMEIITALRTIRSENNVPPERVGRAIIVPEKPEDAVWLTTQMALINQFVKLSETTIDCNAAKKPGFAGSGVVRGIQAYLLLEGLIDKKVEIDRLTKDISKTTALIENAKKRLESEAFVSKAPAEVVAKEKEKIEGLLMNKEKLEKSLAALQ